MLSSSYPFVLTFFSYSSKESAQFFPNKKKGFLTTSQGIKIFIFLISPGSHKQKNIQLFSTVSHKYFLFFLSKVLSQMGNSQGVDFNPGITNGDTQQFVGWQPAHKLRQFSPQFWKLLDTGCNLLPWCIAYPVPLWVRSRAFWWSCWHAWSIYIICNWHPYETFGFTFHESCLVFCFCHLHL